MRRHIVRYRPKPEWAEENKRLIEAVFQELRAKSPEGLRYAVLQLADGAFMHLVEGEEGAIRLPELDAFQRFQSGIKERCLEPPQLTDVTVVGNYRMLGPGQ